MDLDSHRLAVLPADSAEILGSIPLRRTLRMTPQDILPWTPAAIASALLRALPRLAPAPQPVAISIHDRRD